MIEPTREQDSRAEELALRFAQVQVVPPSEVDGPVLCYCNDYGEYAYEHGGTTQSRGLVCKAIITIDADGRTHWSR